MARLVSTLARVDPEGQVVRLTPGRPYAELAALYAGADAFVFASTCENMPNSLLEAMAAGLPIVCSDRAPMPDLLGEGGVYCNSHVPDSIADAMRRVMLEPDLRTRLASVANHRGREYDWTKCARQTFEFLAEIRHRAVTPVGRA
ncbi:MAG: glycosyltransferase [Acidobacteria bacterium]|nr:glycosyltransferase [Acidobacteriota bacterium]